LRVGPESAGAYPGPACYGKGGLSATVSDANLVLGRLRSDNFLGGQMRLDESAAFAAIDRLSRRMKCTVNEAATGVIRVANEHMTRALRVISVERGIDPRDFSLACFGGAGGLHVCALAESLGMQRAMVPAHAGVLSALGMLVAPRGRHLSRTHTGLLEDFEPKVLEDQLDNLRITAESELAAEGIDPRSTKTEYSVDLRYQGQSYTLSVPWQAMNNLAPAFHRLHQHRFGHSLAMPLELVNLRVAVSAPQNSIKPTEPDAGTGVPFDHVKLVGVDNPVPVFQRDALDVSGCLKGPLLIVEPVSTTYVAPGWDCAVTAGGSLSLQVLEKI